MSQTKTIPSSSGSAIPPNRDIFGRLMDLTCGWYQFTEEHSQGDQDDRASALFELYQSVAAYTEPYVSSSEEVKEAVAVKFIYDRIIPTLLSK